MATIKSSFRSKLGHLGTTILSSLLALLFTCIIPFLLIIGGPILVFRKIVSILAKFRPQLGKILTHQSAVLGYDDNLYKHSESFTVLVITLENNLPLDDLKSVFLNNVLHARLSNGEYRYPELKQHYTSWMGFTFWKNYEQFDINNHIHLYENANNGSRTNDEDLQRIRQTLLTAPFKENTSPWEVLLVHNYYPSDPILIAKSAQPLSVIFLKLHHGLADGFSIQKLSLLLMSDELTAKEQKVDARSPPSRRVPRFNCLTNALTAITYPLKCIYEFSFMIIRLMSTKGPWHGSGGSIKTPLLTAVSNIISVQRIKNIKTELNASFSTVLIFVCTSAMEQIMLKKGVKLPKLLPSVVPVPLPGHPDKLRNHL
jgi:hypothetical protein